LKTSLQNYQNQDSEIDELRVMISEDNQRFLEDAQAAEVKYHELKFEYDAFRDEKTKQ
jgi:hypothetical protein